MSGLSDRPKLPRGLLAAFVAVVLLPSAMLVALGIRLLEQDHALEERRRRELADATLERAAAAIQKDIAAIQGRLESRGAWPAAELSPDAVLLWNGSGPLLYQPSNPKLPEPPAEPFAAADRAEFQSGDTGKALALCSSLATSSNATVRAGALLRMARLNRKAGRFEDALAAWNRLATADGVAVEGEPAGLVARRARCRALEEEGRTAELRQEAGRLLAELDAGRWPIDRDTYLFAAEQARRWAGREVEPAAKLLRRASAVSKLWKLRTTREGSLCDEGYTLIWRDDDALVAGPLYRARRWEAPTGVRIACAGEAAPQGLMLAANVTGLPWSISSAPGTQPLPEFSARRTALMAAMVTLLILICAAAYFAWRAVTRELGVARLQSDFVAAVSHEFRTPLTSLRQFNEMLVDEPDLTPDARLSYYKAQGRATDRLSRLVETLLDFGRMEAGRRPYRLEPMDAAELVRNVVAEFSREPLARGFDIQCRTPEHALPVHGDREALSRAIWNLLDNATKYSGDCRQVEVEASANGSAVTVRVVDHGLGIPQHEQGRLFEKFVRGESIRKRGIPGTGIGLAMARHIAEAHGGSVDLKSREGEGSTFSLLLPGRG